MRACVSLEAPLRYAAAVADPASQGGIAEFLEHMAQGDADAGEALDGDDA